MNARKAVLLLAIVMFLTAVIPSALANSESTGIHTTSFFLLLPGQWDISQNSENDVTATSNNGCNILRLYEESLPGDWTDENFFSAVGFENQVSDYAEEVKEIQGKRVKLFQFALDGGYVNHGCFVLYNNKYFMMTLCEIGTSSEDETGKRLEEYIGGMNVYSSLYASDSMDNVTESAQSSENLSTEELRLRMNSIMEELIARQIEESGRVLVADLNGIKIYFDGFTKDAMDDAHIRFIIINNSDKTLPVVVNLDELYVDNWDVLANGHLQVLDPGKNGIGEAWMKWDNCITATEETASKIDVKFSFSVDKGNYEWEKFYESELITFYIK